MGWRGDERRALYREFMLSSSRFEAPPFGSYPTYCGEGACEVEGKRKQLRQSGARD